MDLKEKTGIPWQVLLAYTDPNQRPDRFEVIGVEENSQLRQAYLDEPDTSSHEVVTMSQNPNIGKTTALKIARALSPTRPYRNVRRKRPKKFVLHENHLHD